MPLPTVIDPVTIRAIIAQETRIIDMATAIVNFPMIDQSESLSAAVAEHLAAVALANELACVHESDHPSDQVLHSAAVQLKAWHLAQLDNLLTPL